MFINGEFAFKCATVTKFPRSETQKVEFGLDFNNNFRFVSPNSRIIGQKYIANELRRNVENNQGEASSKNVIDHYSAVYFQCIATKYHFKQMRAQGSKKICC
jgi:hypothetical protein